MISSPEQTVDPMQLDESTAESVWFGVDPGDTGDGVHRPTETVSIPVDKIEDLEDEKLREALHRQYELMSSKIALVAIADAEYRLLRTQTISREPLSLREPDEV